MKKIEIVHENSNLVWPIITEFYTVIGSMKEDAWYAMRISLYEIIEYFQVLFLRIPKKKTNQVQYGINEYILTIYSFLF